MSILYHFNHEGVLIRESEATYDILDNSINIPANATLQSPLWAVFPDLDIFDVSWSIKKYVEPVIEPVIPPTIEELRAGMSLTPAQFRLNLIALNLFEYISAAVASLPATDSRWILWEYSLQFDRLNPVLISFSTELGLSDTQIDAVFTYSNKPL
jgi:hypothetical protein